MPYNRSVVRKMLMAAFNDEDLRTFCFDHFRPVYDEFTSGQPRGERVRMLVEYAERQGKLDTLVDTVRRENEYQYAAFAAQLTQANLLVQAGVNP